LEIAGLREVDLGSLTGDGLSARIRELDRLRNQHDAALLDTVAAWDARQQWAADGALSPATWLAARCEMSRASAAVLVRTSRRLRDMPLTADAARCGELGSAKVVLLANAAGRSDASRKAFARDEELLVRHARRLTVDQVNHLLREWLLRVDAETGNDDADAQHERRRFHLSETFQGMWVLDGTLEPADGAELHAALQAEYDALLRAENAVEGGPRRTPAQRRADALLNLIRGDSAVRPSLTIVVRAEDLRDARGGARIAGGPILDPASVQQMACDAVIRRVTLGADGEILDLGRSQRLISPAQRRALTVRDGGCVFPGCDRPPERCDGHHIVHWTQGGRTDMENLCFLCLAHHTAIHKRGFRVERGPDRRLRFTRPDGIAIIARQHLGTVMRC
jgi:Domain of unknown function (DUF222)/HNH endonuclease